MRNILIILPIFILFSFLPAIAQRMYENVVSSDDYRLEIELEKFEYKTFEPIVVFCRYINLSNRIDTVKNALNRGALCLLKFYVNSSDGRVYESRDRFVDIANFISTTEYILQPGDTGYCIKYIDPVDTNSYRYSKERYGKFRKILPAGEYEINAELERDAGLKVFKPSLKSIRKKFIVSNINYNDAYLLSFYPYSNNDSISFSRGPQNFDRGISNKESSFNEYYIISNVQYLISGLIVGFRNEEDVKKALIDYVQNYPYSFRLIDVVSSFVYAYKDNTSKQILEMDTFGMLYDNILREYLMSSTVRKKILYNYPDPDNIIKDMRNPKE